MSNLAALRTIVGDAHAREAAGADAIDGATPRFCVAPGSVEEVSAVLRLASASRWAVCPRGRGTRLDLGNLPAKVDLVLSTSRIKRLVEHASGDLVAIAEAGIPLLEMQTAVAGANQMLAIDPLGGDSTIGGLIATNASGPRRLRYGTIRDLLIGVTVVLGDGTIARSGGKVVKNVAGYDLGKLFTGSLGTLGVIVQATFRLHPLPVARRLVEIPVDSVDAASTAVLRIMASTLVPAAVEMDWPDEGPRRILLLFEGVEEGVEAQAAGAVALVGATVVEDAFYGRWTAATTQPWQSGGLGLKVTYLPAELTAVMHSIAQAAARWGVRPAVRGSVANGVLYVGFPIDAPEVATGVVGDLRAAAWEGSVVVQSAPAHLRAELDVWGPIGSSLDLMRRVKHQFDPGRVLNPGRFVGGI